MVAAIVAVIGFVGFTAFGGGDEQTKRPVAEGSASPKPAPKQSGGKPAAQPPQTPQAPKPEPSDSAIAAAPKDLVTVVLTADTGESWISAKDHSGRLLFDGTLAQGESKTFTDKESVDLVLGDSRRREAVRERQGDQGRIPVGSGGTSHIHEGRPPPRTAPGGLTRGRPRAERFDPDPRGAAPHPGDLVVRGLGAGAAAGTK